MNNNPCPFPLDNEEYCSLCRDFVENNPQFRSRKTKKQCGISLRSFRRWMVKNGYTELNEKIVKVWMLDCAQKMTVRTVHTKIIILTHFLDYLVSRKLWHENPFRTLRIQHHILGYQGMVRVLKKTGSVAALDKLADIPFSGALGFHFTDYIKYVNALGKYLKGEIWILESFERYLRQHNITDLKQVDASVVAAWNGWIGQASDHQKRRRMAGLKKFFDFLLGQERILVSPIPQIPPYCHRYPLPYVFSREEVRNILAAAEKLPDHQAIPYHGPTYKMVFLLLYTLGLRISEAVNLKLGDIDFIQDSITIRNTKFHKGRVLPFGPRFKAALQHYINEHPLLIKASAEDFLFPTRSYYFDRTPRLCSGSCYVTLKWILKEMSVTPPPATSSPRLHSFRHAFAVHRLENWIREGADVGAKLPLLSAFLGHINVANTQVYLTMTPERLALLGQRFEKAFGILPQVEEMRP